MARDWALIARGLELQIPEEELRKIHGPLQTLTTQFAALIKDLPHDTEPATILPGPEEERS